MYYTSAELIDFEVQHFYDALEEWALFSYEIFLDFIKITMKNLGIFLGICNKQKLKMSWVYSTVKKIQSIFHHFYVWTEKNFM